MYRVSAGGVALLVNMLRAEGLDASRLCREAGLDMGQLGQADAFFRRQDAYRLMELAALESGNPGIGLRAHAHFLPGSFQMVGYVMMSSPNMKVALEQLSRFSPLIGSGFSVTLAPEGRALLRLSFAEHPQDGYPQPRQFEDAGVAALLGFCRWLTGEGQPQPRQLTFTYDEPADTAEYQKLSACPLHFGARHTSILFDRHELLRPLSTANEVMALLHGRFAEFRLRQLYGGSYSARVQTMVIESLNQGACDMESIAMALCISKRTLQRGLAREGANFKDILSDARRQMADYYLRHCPYDLTRVGELLAFKDQSSFHKACLRWFGMSPGRYRAGGREGDCAVA
ncbi:AraC family transcriptional regulator [Zestomonas carbonaria]|uniref:HTH-type transcriptional regulator VirS n=1 Tax=Zestomonas carbonaria TaxID=2762745 RepID=A0A7U7EQ05_9GAMM|nr:AraC family transcriptional regulator [Pseudomonas carbonaria]CAD5108643.1 HTH-type transcriptional regulator VirS [Pseudomonas carbonaria]